MIFQKFGHKLQSAFITSFAVPYSTPCIMLIFEFCNFFHVSFSQLPIEYILPLQEITEILT